MIQVTAIFDVGKTNKKVLLFDNSLNLIFEKEVRFKELKDDDGFERDDVEGFIKWMNGILNELLANKKYDIKALNFSTYGATIACLDENGNLAAPVYNYLKTMPKRVLNGFYEKYGGVEEFSRKTASPALDMLNSGLQIYYLKKAKPEMYKKTKNILHFPQYLSFLFTGKPVSEYTSIGCHTALWDFDNMKYHQWLADERISLPVPVSNNTTYKVKISGKEIKVGIGIHDSSSSLVPYLRANQGKEFILISTGTWAINMNPFSKDQLTAEELKKDCLCYLSVDQNQVKSSRLFLGHIHEVNSIKLSQYFNVAENEFKRVQADHELIKKMIIEDKMVFFPDGIPSDYMGRLDPLIRFTGYSGAYHQLIYELAKIEAETIKLALDKKDTTQDMFITGGFAKNDIFTILLGYFFRSKNVYTANVDNATALGAAMMVMPESATSDFKCELSPVKQL